MTVSGPLVLVALPVAVAVVSWLLRRWTAVAALLSSLTAAGLAWLVATASLEAPTLVLGVSLAFHEPWLVLGRALAVTAATRWPIVWVFAALAVSQMVMVPAVSRSSLFGFNLGITALLVAALLSTQIVYTALLLVLAYLLTIFPLQETALRARGGLHYIAYAVLALPGLMLTQVLLEQYTLTPTATPLLTTARGLLLVSFAMLLGAFPFQAWVSNLTRDGAPRMFPFVFSVNLGAAWFVLLAYLEAYTWLSEGQAFGVLTGVVGLLMVVFGGVLAASHQRLSRMTGYLLVSEQGLWLAALSLRSAESLGWVMGLLLVRPLALGLLSLGLEGLRAAGGGDDALEVVRGLGWRAPWASAAFMAGAWALMGLPLSLNFVLRWSLVSAWAQHTALPEALMLAGTLGGLAGLARAVQVLFAGPRRQADIPCPWVRRVAVVVLGVLLLLSGLFPQPLLHLATVLAQQYTFLGR